MAILRLTPNSGPIALKPRGRCPACGKAISKRQDAVLIHGDHFHRACAYYRPRPRLRA